jgi:predicted nucleotidyltransferase
VNVEAFLDAAKSWAAARSDIAGLALIGSRAAGTGRPDSDVDLVLLGDDPEALVTGDWFLQFGRVRSVEVESYGALRSLRVRYEDGPEVEFGIAGRDWVRLPLDAGTANVLSSGVRILHDPVDLFRAATVSRP